jgi:hypothetical protein
MDLGLQIDDFKVSHNISMTDANWAKLKAAAAQFGKPINGFVVILVDNYNLLVELRRAEGGL